MREGLKAEELHRATCKEAEGDIRLDTWAAVAVHRAERMPVRYIREAATAEPSAVGMDMADRQAQRKEGMPDKVDRQSADREDRPVEEEGMLPRGDTVRGVAAGYIRRKAGRQGTHN